MAADNMHEEEVVVHAAKERVGTDYDKIEEQRAEIKALKEMQRDPSLMEDHVAHKIEESHNQWNDPHEQDAKVIAADASKWDNGSVYFCASKMWTVWLFVDWLKTTKSVFALCSCPYFPYFDCVCSL